MSAGAPNKRPYGLFSYSLAQVLAMNPAMTYRQLGEQVLHRYRQQVRGQPTPLFEGEGSSLDAPVFGPQAGASVLFMPAGDRPGATVVTKQDAVAGRPSSRGVGT